MGDIVKTKYSDSEISKASDFQHTASTPMEMLHSIFDGAFADVFNSLVVSGLDVTQLVAVVSTCMVEDFLGNPITVTPPMVDPASRYLESDVATMLRLQVLATGVSDTTKSTIYWFPFSNSPVGDWVKVYDQIIPPSGIIDITNMTGITEVPGKPRGANGGFWGSVPFIVGGGGRMHSIITFPSGIA